MSITAGWLLLNLAYLIYTASGLFKDMLQLRVVWMLSTLFFISHGIVDRLWPAVWWNVPVLLIHAYMIGSLLRSRRGVDLSDEEEAIRTLIFPDLDRVDFNTMWHCGEERTVGDVVLITKDEEVRELILILDGEVDVEVSNELTVRLSQYRLVGEMTSLSGGAATATVRTNGIVRMRAWDKEALNECANRLPQVQVSLLKAMGHEVTRKLR